MSDPRHLPSEARRMEPADGALMGVHTVLVILVSVLFCAALPWLSIVFRTSDPAVGHLPFGPLILLLVVCWVVAPIVRRTLGKERGVTRTGLLLYCVVLSVGGFSGPFSVMQIAPNIASARYYATPTNRFETEILPHIPDSLAIKDERLATGFYEGWRATRLPWRQWSGPLVRWGTLVFLYFITSSCLVGVLRRRWIDYERLPFPLAEIPLFMARRGHFGMARDNPATRRSLLVVGISIPLVLHSYNALHYYVPMVPQIPLGPYQFGSVLRSRPWDAAAPWLTTYLRVSVLAIGYVMPSSMALGFFGCFLGFVAITVLARFVGDPTLGPLRLNSYTSALHHQAGAYCGLVVFSLWAARSDLAAAARSLWRSLTGAENRTRHPDRWMLLGLIVGGCAMGGWAVAAGISPLVAVAFLAAALALEFGYSLIAAMSGLPVLQTNNMPQDFLVAFVPGRSLGYRNLVMVGLFERLFSWYKQHSSMPSVLQAMKVADSGRIPDGRLAASVLTTVCLVIVLNSATMLHLGYNRGALMQTGTWYSAPGMNNPRYAFEWAQRSINAPEHDPQFHWMILGALTMCGMQALYRHFIWWPIHPLGLLMPVGWQITAAWFSVMIGWGIGRAITRWTGPKVYVSARPLFVGLVIGDALAAGLWLAIDTLVGVRGHAVPTTF